MEPNLRPMDDVDRILDQWRLARPDLDLRAMGPVGRLSRIAHQFSRRMGATFARHGLNAAGFDVLATLRRAPAPHALSAGALMNAMMITSGTMTNRIEQLVKAGLITRSPDPEDARRAVVKLTDRGFALVEGVLADHVATQNALLTGLSAQEAQQLDRLLAKLMVALESDAG
ncbi:MarR family winged helix-turn-helix transcriptional regulator [Oceaniglobus trochenteri]|uniref:MarR family winged helix-turn-helix transcriptional regulator n=1 Tax=Oceaniglobus trochenteri TaxID=2763260 RepID=UPI001CFF96B6|nr:MarR family transcriptional regulator [Oceaniglobus trochenteri]